jgi:hypothetical protein
VLTSEEHLKRNPVKKVKGKHGGPAHWDGLSTLYMLLAQEYPAIVTTTDQQWLTALLTSGRE